MLKAKEGLKAHNLMEELHTDSIDGGSEALNRLGHVMGQRTHSNKYPVNRITRHLLTPAPTSHRDTYPF